MEMVERMDSKLAGSATRFDEAFDLGYRVSS
jgi:hypothetical protein